MWGHKSLKQKKILTVDKVFQQDAAADGKNGGEVAAPPLRMRQWRLTLQSIDEVRGVKSLEIFPSLLNKAANTKYSRLLAVEMLEIIYTFN
ncbi:hypothetical protein MA16_Dca016241 [Dendrobium catenatum]|uniref:Uncharacterized protein n=1 Tax=Dendrobium catenatum TaxID=906689 RepID=A0A2I0VVU4_9ASPA|nr:hypothetical protein MA16_Dca016241 [Dendrobium catenatum]